MHDATRLLGLRDPPVVQSFHPEGLSPFLLIADHAGRVIPQALATLGLTESDLGRHIAWDIGIAGLATRLSEQLDAALIMQTYSRLVIDCNRPLDAPDLIAISSEDTPIPGNLDMSVQARAQRIEEIFRPYHAAIVNTLAVRDAAKLLTIMVSLHSFTPVYRGVARPWHVGLLYNRDPRLARALLSLLRAESGLVVGDNEPYAVSDATDFTIPVHAEQRGLLHVEIEIRQDLIADVGGRTVWAQRLARLLPLALARCANEGGAAHT
jgi:predicted N-formylglutamate amidohydrolase